MHWTYSVGLIWLFLCVYAKGHRLLNNIWEKGDDCSALSFLASGSRGEGVWAKNPCGCWVEAFPEKRCSVCLRERGCILQLRQRRWCIGSPSLSPVFLVVMRDLWARVPQRGRTKAWVLSQLAEGRTCPLSGPRCGSTRPPWWAFYFVGDTITKYYRLGGLLTNRNSFLPMPEAGKYKIKFPAWSCSGERPLPGS